MVNIQYSPSNFCRLYHNYDEDDKKGHITLYYVAYPYNFAEFCQDTSWPRESLRFGQSTHPNSQSTEVTMIDIIVHKNIFHQNHFFLVGKCL